MYSGFCSSQAYLLADELSELRWLVASRSLSLRGICFGAVRVITTAGHRQARGVHSVSWAPKQSECPPPPKRGVYKVRAVLQIASWKLGRKWGRGGG